MSKPTATNRSDLFTPPLVQSSRQYQSAESLTFRRIGEAGAAIERRRLRLTDPKGQSFGGAV